MLVQSLSIGEGVEVWRDKSRSMEENQKNSLNQINGTTSGPQRNLAAENQSSFQLVRIRINLDQDRQQAAGLLAE